MLDSLDEGVVFVDPKGKVQLVNQAAENILGQKRSKLEGAPLDAILRTREETTLLDCTGENLSTSRPMCWQIFWCGMTRTKSPA